MVTENQQSGNALSISPQRIAHYGKLTAYNLAIRRTKTQDDWWDDRDGIATYNYHSNGAILSTNNEPSKESSYDVADHQAYDIDRHLIRVLMDDISLIENQEPWDKGYRWSTCRSPRRQNVAECTNPECEMHGHQHILPFSCEIRICPCCHKRHSAEMRRKIKPVLKELIRLNPPKKYGGRRLRMVTVTSELSPVGCSLDEGRRRLKTFIGYVSKLIKKMKWNQDGNGAYRAIEVGQRGFKFHAHIMVWCEYVEQAKLSDEWREISGSFIVDIRDRMPKNDKQLDDALDESMKYVIKMSKHEDDDGNELSARDAALLHDLSLEEVYIRTLLVLRGVRRIQGYGVLYGIKDEELKLLCPACGELLSVSEFIPVDDLLNLTPAINLSAPRAPPKSKNHVQLSYWSTNVVQY